MRPRTLQISYNLAALPNAVHQLRQWGNAFSLYTFSGDLGAGKTTFIREWCRQLGITDAVSSPTFSLVNEYHTANRIRVYHMDFYRLRDAAEAYEAGLETLLTEPGAVIFIEWPENAAELLPATQINIHIETLDADQRLLTATQP